MTRLDRKLVRLTHSKHNGEDIVVELHATALFLRTEGSRGSFRSPLNRVVRTRARPRRQTRR
jgi:hypothetical protein